MTTAQSKRSAGHGAWAVPAKTSRASMPPLPADAVAKFKAEVLRTPETARAFLYENGFITKNGRLTKRYGG
jgi:hypothetical protein